MTPRWKANRIAYMWDSNMHRAIIEYWGKEVGELVVFKRGAYVFAKGDYKRFPGESEARSFVAKRIAKYEKDNAQQA